MGFASLPTTLFFFFLQRYIKILFFYVIICEWTQSWSCFSQRLRSSIVSYWKRFCGITYWIAALRNKIVSYKYLHCLLEWSKSGNYFAYLLLFWTTGLNFRPIINLSDVAEVKELWEPQFPELTLLVFLSLGFFLGASSLDHAHFGFKSE